MKYYLDSSFWIALLNKKDVPHKKAKKFFERNKHKQIYASEIIYTEVKNKIDANIILEKAAPIPIEENEFQKAIKLDVETNIGINDCLHVYLCKKHGMIRISFDKHWNLLGEILKTSVICL